MVGELNRENSTSFKASSKVKDYFQLTKFTLSFTVVFSCVVCYLLAPTVIGFDLKMILLLSLSGLMIAGSANTINQAVEKDTDAMMKRTANRPVASGRMTPGEAYIFAFITGVLGVFSMYYFFNFTSAVISAASLFLYAFVYTPLKKINSTAVLVGAFPGALPCLIGWVAGFPPDTAISWTGGLVLFGIQFLWQFPHFWAIAWVAHKDYSKAGFKLLPSDKGPTKFTALQALLYSVLMLPVGMLPYYFAMSGQISFFILIICNFFMIVQSARLYADMSIKAARRVMFSSYIYLPIVLLALLADKL